MLPKLGREIALLCLPVLIIGVVALRRNGNNAPEDVWSGKPRLLTRMKQLDVTPVDQYRGYTQRIEIDQWAAGTLTPTPAPRPRAIRSYRQIMPGYSSLYVMYRQGKTWKRTLSVTENAEQVTDKSLKVPSVKPAIASLKLETIDSAGLDREKFTTRYVLRLPTSPRVEEAYLMGKTAAEMQDRDTRMLSGVSTDEPVGHHDLNSKPMKVRLDTTEDQTPSIPSQPDWEVAKTTVFPPGQIEPNSLFIDLTLDSPTHVNPTGALLMIKPRLLDAKGHEVSAGPSYGTGGRTAAPGTIEANVQFTVTKKQWKTVPKPLVFQTALSVNGGWPDEVNIELEMPNAKSVAKPSKLRFVRDPLPIQ